MSGVAATLALPMLAMLAVLAVLALSRHSERFCYRFLLAIPVEVGTDEES